MRKDTRYALLSVYDKTGIAYFAKKLERFGYKIIASEGTGAELARHNISFTPAVAVSKNPQKLKDCIKTISFYIEGGILFDRSNTSHIKQISELGILPIDIVACNFPPLSEVVKVPNDFNISKIDVGGPLMVRSAAVNFKHALVVVDINDYKEVIKAIQKDSISLEYRKQLAIKAFEYINSYTESIIKYLKNTRFNKR